MDPPRAPRSSRLTPLSGELHEVEPSRLERAIGRLGRLRASRRRRRMSRMQRRPVFGALLYIGTRYILWLVALDLVASVLVVKGVKPALAFYLLMLVPATIALFALLGTAEPGRFDAAPVAAGSGD